MNILTKDSSALKKDNNILTCNFVHPKGDLEITNNGTHDIREYKTVEVNVYDNLQARIDNGQTDYLFAGYPQDLLNKHIEQLNINNIKKYNSIFRESTAAYIPEKFKINEGPIGTYDASYLFHGMINLIEIPNLNYSLIKYFSSMFYECKNIISAAIDTSNATSVSSIYYRCEKIKTIDFTSLDKISSSSGTSFMCYYCYSLTKFIIRNMTVIPPLNTNSFNKCYHFTGTYNRTYNPDSLKDGRIYVPDNMVDSLKSATNWSTYADIIVPLSTLEE